MQEHKGKVPMEVSMNVWGIVVQCDIQTELHGSVFYNGITLLRCFV